MENLFVKKQKREIPIFFATDDNYIPFLDVALRSLIDNASRDYIYTINILNTGIKQENIEKIKMLEDDVFTINFVDISQDIEPIKSKLKNVYHFSIVTYYRLFIETLFPQYEKVLYLDCDITILGDISKLYNINLGNNYIGAVMEQVINGAQVFREYAEFGVGIKPEKYINAGILVMNLTQFRKHNICEQFCYLISKYNFDVVDPDQAYLNLLCKDKIKYLPTGWNKESVPGKLEGDLNIVHYALYKKPWQYDNVLNDEYFWEYAKTSPFYNEIVDRKANFSDEQKQKKEQANIEICEHAQRITDADNNMCKTMFADDNLFGKLEEIATATANMVVLNGGVEVI